MRREDNLVHNVKHSVATHSVVELDTGETVNVDDTEAQNLGDIHADRCARQEGVKAVMLLRQVCVSAGGVSSLVVKCVAIYCRVGRDGVLENGVQVFFALFCIEKESIRFSPQGLEGIVARSEKGAALDVLAVDKLDKIGLLVGQEKCREVGREEGEDEANRWRWHKYVTNSVDNTVGSFLERGELAFVFSS